MLFGNGDKEVKLYTDANWFSGHVGIDCLLLRPTGLYKGTSVDGRHLRIALSCDHDLGTGLGTLKYINERGVNEKPRQF